MIILVQEASVVQKYYFFVYALALRVEISSVFFFSNTYIFKVPLGPRLLLKMFCKDLAAPVLMMSACVCFATSEF